MEPLKKRGEPRLRQGLSKRALHDIIEYSVLHFKLTFYFSLIECSALPSVNWGQIYTFLSDSFVSSEAAYATAKTLTETGSDGALLKSRWLCPHSVKLIR